MFVPAPQSDQSFDPIEEPPKSTSPDLDGNRDERVEALLEQYNRFAHVVFEETGVLANERKGYDEWIEAMKKTDVDLLSYENFFKKKANKLIEAALAVYFDDFLPELDAAEVEEESRQDAIARFKDPELDLQRKKEWVRHHVRKWKALLRKREDFLRDPRLQKLQKKDPQLQTLRTMGVSLAILLQQKEFLKLTPHQMKDMLLGAKAAVDAATNTERGDLYAQMVSHLQKPLKDEVISPENVGSLLASIFHKRASTDSIRVFMHGEGSGTIGDFIKQRYAVKREYDELRSQLEQLRGSDTARVQDMLSPDRFLRMPYPKRVRYVAWVRDHLVQEGRGEKKRQIVPISSKLKQPSPEEQNAKERAEGAARLIDTVYEQMDVSMRPTVTRFLRDAQGAALLGKFGMMFDNYGGWRQAHPDADEEIAQGGGELGRKRTKRRAEEGKDIGLHDASATETAGRQYLRRDEYARGSMTLHHIELGSPVAVRGFEELLRSVHDIPRLRLMAFSGFLDGKPLGGEWHATLRPKLAALQSAATTLQQTGYRYDPVLKKLSKPRVLGNAA